MNGIAKPYFTMIGKVIGAFQAANTYDVITDHGRFTCTYSNGAGDLMVGRAGGISLGTTVWICAHPRFPTGHIITTSTVPWYPDPALAPKQFLVYPQVSGFDPSNRIIGQLYTDGIIGFQNRSSDVGHDLCNGEWAMMSPHGPGVGTELFRAFVRGGPASGVFCFGDSQLTRIMGLDYEFISLDRFDYIRRDNNAIVEVKAKVFYPSEAIANQLPRVLEVKGAIHSGEQRILTTAAAPGTGRMALFHEHVDVDGTYTATSASGIHFQRWCGINVPEEAQAPPAVGPLLAETPLDADDVRDKVLTTPPLFVSTSDTTPLSFVQRHIDMVQAQLVRSNSGFDGLPIQWLQNTPDGLPDDLYHPDYTSGMWYNLPQSFSLEIDPNVGKKTFYVGRSTFSLMPDGSVIVEDAYNSQIIMAGGNIMYSAAKSLIFEAGQDIFMIAGRHATVKANGEVELESNQGGVGVKASKQLAMVGGVSGTGGVLVENQASADAIAGTGTAQTVGNLYFKSASNIISYAPNICMTTDQYSGNIFMNTANLLMKTVSTSLEADNGFTIYFDQTGATSYVFAPTECAMPGQLVTTAVYATGNSVFTGGLIVGSDIISGGEMASASGVLGQSDGVGITITQVTQNIATNAQSVKTIVKSFISAFTKFLATKTPFNTKLGALLGFSWPTSKQFGTVAPGAFILPESRAQTLMRVGPNTGQVWTEETVKSPAGDGVVTSCYPGYAAWTSPNFYQYDSDQVLYFDITTGLPFVQDPPDATLPTPVIVSADKNYYIGA